MGKIVKYCSSCDESFAEKFGFCPNCGKGMQAFEMNPLAGAPIGVEEKSNVGAASNGDGSKAEIVSPVFAETPARVETPKVAETAAVASPVSQTQPVFARTEIPAVETKTETIKAPKPEAPAREAKTFAAATSGNGNNSQKSADGYRTVESRQYQNDGGFHITVIEEQNVKQRNVLLLGSLLLIMSLAMGGMVYSLFNNNISIAAIGEDSGLSIPITDEVPMEVEPEEKPKNDKDAGGGGGGGKNAPTPTSKGVLANQEEKPMIPPSANMDRVTNPAIPITVATQGNVKQKPSDEHYGDPNSKYGLSSDGMGSGGGQGSGIGTGQGSGRGTGAGSGIGSGFGGGEGDGTGNGKGTGNQGIGAPPPPPKKPEPVGPTTGVSILSKPRANYTDAARQNQVQGTVTLRVTFTASGQIGSISPVNGLPYGLTEQAIAAARSIKFEPAKKNGVPQTVTKQVQYSFTIY